MGCPLGRDKPSTQFAGHAQFPHTPSPRSRSDRGIHPQRNLDLRSLPRNRSQTKQGTCIPRSLLESACIRIGSPSLACTHTHAAIFTVSCDVCDPENAIAAYHESFCSAGGVFELHGHHYREHDLRSRWPGMGEGDRSDKRRPPNRRGEFLA